MQMAAEDGMAREKTADTSLSATESAPRSPKNKVNFFCSFGGKILPRPADGSLRYVGGETRVVSVPRDIKFSELMKKLASIAEGNMVLKYQLISEDLDALITVKSDEDILHMLEEYDRYKLSSGRPKLRAYLFPSTPIIPEHHDAIDARSPEERYIDAVNGFSLITRQHSLSSDRPDFFIGFNSSAGSFPKSTESTKIDTSRLESITPTFGYPKRSALIHKVQSSPSICSLSSYPQLYQQQQRLNSTLLQQFHHHQYYQHHGVGGLQSPERLVSVRSVGGGLQSPERLEGGLQSSERLALVQSVGQTESWKCHVVQNPTTRLLRHSSLRGSGNPPLFL